MMTYSVLMNTTASLVGASCFFSDAKVRIIMFIFQKEHLHLEKMTKNINSQSEFILKKHYLCTSIPQKTSLSCIEFPSVFL